MINELSECQFCRNIVSVSHANVDHRNNLKLLCVPGSREAIKCTRHVVDNNEAEKMSHF